MTPTRVAICALTYLRPEGLERLLSGLAELVVPGDIVVRVVIVDNDPERSAEAIVGTAAERIEGFGPDGPDLVYRCEPARGISHARNAAVEQADKWRADWVCFIDDDEWPDRQWLVEFLATAQATDADVVSGPVVPVFEQPPPAWVTDGGFFDCRRHQHNASMHYATTSSVLIRAQALTTVPGPFDPVFGMSGGEDTHLFEQLRENGHRLVWSDTATVFETVPPSRTNSDWLLKREFRRGQTLGLTLRHRGASRLLLAKRAAKGVPALGAGLATTVVGLPRGKARWFRGVRRCGFGAGILSGLLGRQHQEYEIIHGT